jgi:tetratricopeptide (TPR) repeat protein
MTVTFAVQFEIINTKLTMDKHTQREESLSGTTSLANTSLKPAFTVLATVIFTLFAFLSSQGQNSGYSSANKFSNCIRSMQTTNNQQVRSNFAVQYFIGQHCTTAQLQDACYYLNNDLSKYNLCLAAYPNVIDHANFFNIYDSFTQFSYVIRLYHDTQEKDMIMFLQNEFQLSGSSNSNAKIELLIEKGDLLLSGNRFDEAIDAYTEAMSLSPGDLTLREKIKEVNNRRLELANSIQEEENRNVMFYSLIQKGDVQMSAGQFDEAILFYEEAMNLKPGDRTAYLKIKEVNKRKQEQALQPPIECKTDGNEFANILSAITDQRYSSDKISLSKKYIEKKCFSMGQYKQIVGLFHMDDEKLEIIKYLYDYIADTSKMYEFRNEFRYPSAKSKLDEFLITKE